MGTDPRSRSFWMELFARIITILIFTGVGTEFVGLVFATDFIFSHPGVPVPLLIRQGFTVSCSLTLIGMWLMRVWVIRHTGGISFEQERALRIVFCITFAISYLMLCIMAYSPNPFG